MFACQGVRRLTRDTAAAAAVANATADAALTLPQVVGGTDNVHIQGQAAVRNQTGSGNLIFGYTRPLTQRDTLDGSLVLGLRSLLTLTSTRQLDPFTSASATATWGLSEGLGFQISSTRQLPGSCTAAWAWVLGPRGASGMSLSVSHRRDKASLQGKVELGAVTALSARASLMLTSTITLRAIVSGGWGDVRGRVCAGGESKRVEGARL